MADLYQERNRIESILQEGLFFTPQDLPGKESPAGAYLGKLITEKAIEIRKDTNGMYFHITDPNITREDLVAGFPVNGDVYDSQLDLEAAVAQPEIIGTKLQPYTGTGAEWAGDTGTGYLARTEDLPGLTADLTQRNSEMELLIPQIEAAATLEARMNGAQAAARLRNGVYQVTYAVFGGAVAGALDAAVNTVASLVDSLQEKSYAYPLVFGGAALGSAAYSAGAFLSENYEITLSGELTATAVGAITLPVLVGLGKRVSDSIKNRNQETAANTSTA